MTSSWELPNIKLRMKKIATLLLTLAFLIVVPVVLAETPPPTRAPINFNITAPTGAVSAPVGTIVNNAIKIIFSIGGFLVLIFLIIGAFQWIMSGGDKEAVGKARQRITHALIGLAILVLAFVIAQVIQSILGVNILNVDLPRLDTLPLTPTPTIGP